MRAAVVTVKLKYVMRDVDRHGTVRYYFRRNRSDKKVKLPGLPGSAEFQAAYAAALAGQQIPGKVVLERVPQGSLEWLCNQYYASTGFRAELKESSQAQRRNVLRVICRVAGPLPYAKLEARHITAWMDDRADRPEAANNLLRALRGLFAFAMSRQLAKVDPTASIKKVRTKTDGFHTWTVDEVRQFLATHGPGTMPRLVLALALFTGLRRSDLIGIGQQHIDAEGYIVLRTTKTGSTVEIPVLPQLREVLDTTPRRGMLFIENAYGRPYTAASLGNQFRTWANKAKLPGCTLHGLRKAGATIAANNGATDRQLMAIYGWSKADMATLYTRRRDNRKLAGEGMGLISLGPEPVKKVVDM